MSRIFAFGLVAVVSLAGCGMTIGESFAKHGTDRAAFEMQCPKEQLQISYLNVSSDDPDYAGAQVGVSGCDRKTVYVLVYGAGWVLNSENSSLKP